MSKCVKKAFEDDCTLYTDEGLKLWKETYEFIEGIRKDLVFTEGLDSNDVKLFLVSTIFEITP